MNNWTNDIYNKLSNRKGKAPAGLLDDIKLEMSRRGISPVSKRIKPLWYLRTAAAAVFIAVVLGTGYYFVSEQKFEGPAKTARNIHNEIVPQPESETIYADTTSVQNENPLPALKAKYSNPSSRGVQDYLAENKAETETVLNESDNVEPEESTSEEIQTDNSEKTEPKAKEYKSSELRESNETGLYNRDSFYEVPKIKSKTSKISFGAFYAGTMTEKSSAMTGFLTMADPIGSHNKDMSEHADVKDFTSDSRTKTKHYQPVKVGVSFKYQINSRWGIQTGLNYSYLYSETNNVSSTSSFKSNQRLHYLGIPLNVACNIWTNDKFNIYATAGGQLEKLVSGNINTDFKINGADKTHVREKVTENNIHSSVNLSAGAEYMFTRNISIYAEPGIVYYFDNKSPVESVYNQNTVKFNINVGLRYTLNN